MNRRHEPGSRESEQCWLLCFRIEEWAGGYDGFWDVNAASGHEPGISAAIRQMFNSGNESTNVILSNVAMRTCRW